MKFIEAKNFLIELSWACVTNLASIIDSKDGWQSGMNKDENCYKYSG